MLITPRKGKIITDRRIVDPIFMFVGAGEGREVESSRRASIFQVPRLFWQLRLGRSEAPEKHRSLVACFLLQCYANPLGRVPLSSKGEEEKY